MKQITELKILINLAHHDEVSGTSIADDGTKFYWTEGRGSSTVAVRPDGTRDDDVYDYGRIFDDVSAGRMMTIPEEIEWELTYHGNGGVNNDPDPIVEAYIDHCLLTPNGWLKETTTLTIASLDQNGVPDVVLDGNERYQVNVFDSKKTYGKVGDKITGSVGVSSTTPDFKYCEI